MDNEAEASYDSTAVAGGGTVTNGQGQPVIVNNHFNGREETKREVYNPQPEPQPTISRYMLLKIVALGLFFTNIITALAVMILMWLYLPASQKIGELQEQNEHLINSCEGGAKFSYAIVKEML